MASPALMARRIKVAPSILSARFDRLGEQVREAVEGAADLPHIDVMDGHFVPNLTMGPAIVRSIRPLTDVPFDAHLMVTRPQDFVKAFAEAGGGGPPPRCGGPPGLRGSGLPPGRRPEDPRGAGVHRPGGAARAAPGRRRERST